MYCDEVYNALSNVVSDWGANMDSDINTYYIGAEFEQ